MKQISINDISDFKIGQAEDRELGTGCTVIIAEQGAAAGIDVRGGGPATRETQTLSPLTNAEFIHAVLLAGGSAYGLDASGGVMKYLLEKNIGLDVGITKVPLVTQCDIFDLGINGRDVGWPDQAMAYRACEMAEIRNYKDGCYGAGTGAMVGKTCGRPYGMKSGIGSYAVQIGDLQVGAVVAVNACGDVFDWKNGQKVAGFLSEDKMSFRNATEYMYQNYEVVKNKFTGNTTIGVIITNAAFSKAELCKIAGMAQNGMARAIRPVHTSVDGDALVAFASGKIEADRDMVGTLAADVVAEAILVAVRNAESLYGYTALKDLTF